MGKKTINVEIKIGTNARLDISWDDGRDDFPRGTYRRKPNADIASIVIPTENVNLFRIQAGDDANPTDLRILNVFEWDGTSEPQATWLDPGLGRGNGDVEFTEQRG